jgi:hypothetical protein
LTIRENGSAEAVDGRRGDTFQTPPSFAKKLEFLPGEVVMGTGKLFLVDPETITIGVLDSIPGGQASLECPKPIGSCHRMVNLPHRA